MRTRPLHSRGAAAIVLAASALALAGCAGVSQTSAPTPTVTVTTTVTATATPSPSSTLTTHDIWLACMSAVQSQWKEIGGDHVTWPAFEPSTTTTPQSDGSTQIIIGFQADGAQYGSIGTCDVGGTPTSPTVAFQGFSDLS